MVEGRRRKRLSNDLVIFVKTRIAPQEEERNENVNNGDDKQKVALLT